MAIHGANGQLFRMLFAYVRTVDSTSSQATCSFKREYRPYHTLPWSPMWPDAGGLKIHLMPLCAQNPLFADFTRQRHPLVPYLLW